MNQRKQEEEKKIKFTISLDPKIYKIMQYENVVKSRLIEKLLKEYYDGKSL